MSGHKWSQRTSGRTLLTRSQHPDLVDLSVRGKEITIKHRQERRTTKPANKTSLHCFTFTLYEVITKMRNLQRNGENWVQIKQRYVFVRNGKDLPIA